MKKIPKLSQLGEITQSENADVTQPLSTTPLHGSAARWFRAALQVNPYEYAGNPSPKSSYPDEARYNEALLDECEAQGIEILAITDHWCATSAEGLISDATTRGITVLPGFEANTSEGIHLLVIFEKGKKLEDITLAIGACGVIPGDPHAVAEKPYSEIVNIMTNLGALVIPAHVNIANSGLLSRIKGAPLVPMIKNSKVYAMGIVPGAPEMGDQVAIIDNRSPYKRKHAIVPIYADDVMGPSGLASTGGSSWFKMCEPSLAGLTHALRTAETRVSLQDPKSSSRVLLRELSWKGGFLDGQTIPIAEDLTALIGGRGTGKSTAIESLRYVLELDPIGSNARDDHEAVVKGVIGTATTISLTVDVISPQPASYTIERTVPDAAIVKDASGSTTNLRPRDVVGSLEIFGQHELAELAQDKNLMAEMVSRVAGELKADAPRPEILERLKENRRLFTLLEKEKEELEDALADIPRLEEQSKRFKETDIGSKLQQQTDLESEARSFTEAADRIQNTQKAIDALEVEALITQLQSELPVNTKSSRAKDIDPVGKALEELSTALSSSVSAIVSSVEAAQLAVSAAKESWSAKVEPLKEENAEVFRGLVAEGHSPDKYLTTQTQLAALTKRSEQRASLREREGRLRLERSQLLADLAGTDSEVTKELTAAIKAANAKTASAVVVKPIANPDRSQVKAIIDSYFSTPRTKIMAAIDREDFSTTEFVSAARKGETGLKDYGISDSQLTHLLSHGEPLFRELEEVSVGRAVDIQLNIAPKGAGLNLKSMDELSKGQRATALLMLLLGASTSPLIIDQPEDDLDNRFVYNGVVRHLRTLKGKRQIVVSTHNANVPVLGDAELVVTLEGDGSNGRLVSDGIGSLDTASVRQHAEDLLEGGRDAFSARKHLYGF
ncbi:DNA repair ATPase RecN [Mycetocola sp. BIGb0189]|uniref:TrlF family AAA-like ATPase n=1 Tax=Mycetocola sp. BIGb0189 TaxID=2940604 RepID=UPI002166D4D8|nr:AAA family ATPase [Mycetocola sp. BIGb0189]MCS4275155.1 DNA repair ATPase RecN [Mycetocola sp. BIGb0189]